MAGSLSRSPLRPMCRFTAVPAVSDFATSRSLSALIGQGLNHRGRVISVEIGNPIRSKGSSCRKCFKVIRSALEGTCQLQEDGAVIVSSPTIEASEPVDLSSVVALQTVMNPQNSGEVKSPHPFAHLKVGKRWRELQGQNNWKGLLDPIDDVLRGEVLRYGEFAQAIYDSFDYDTFSKYVGSAKYGKKRFLSKVGLANRGYDVTDYLYVTAGSDIANAIPNFFKLVDPEATDLEDIWDDMSNWSGYVAVTTDPQEIERLGRRDIMVVWRGTVTKLEWLENVRDFLIPAGLDPRRAGQGGIVDLKVEAGFLQMYKASNDNSLYTTKSARRQVLEAVSRLMEKYQDEDLSITVVGHSLGSALAILSGYDLAETCINQKMNIPHVIDGWDKPSPERNPNQATELTNSDEVETVPITVYSFGGPRVGNDPFCDRMEELGVKVLRICNKKDIVVEMPGLLFNERLIFLETTVLKPLWTLLGMLPWTYTHYGVPLYIDHRDSTFLQKSNNLGDAHNLEVYLHALDGYHGTGQPFSLVIDRDLALVNKDTDCLLKHFAIPPAWRQVENKGLVLGENGRWVHRERDLEDHPEYTSLDGASSQSTRFSSIK